MVTVEDYEEQLAKAGEFHGEICGGIAIGTKLAMYGMELMGFELNKRHKNLIVFLEIDRCMADAVQSVTKCTMGKRSLKQMYYGKFAVTFYNMDTGEAIRVSDADANKHDKKIETKDEMIERFKRTPAEELFKVEKVHVDLNPSQMPGKAGGASALKFDLHKRRRGADQHIFCGRRDSKDLSQLFRSLAKGAPCKAPPSFLRLPAPL